MLTYRKSEGLEIIGYFDFHFARYQDSKCSTFGYIYMLVGGVISWKSVKQTLIDLSTMATKFVACFETSNHEIWLQNFVNSLWVIYFNNNNLTVLYFNNNKSFTKSKFIDINCNGSIVNIQDGPYCIKEKSKDK
ncbi:hypothetical protein CR513_11842, partial [Mucuna pruriens]